MLDDANTRDFGVLLRQYRLEAGLTQESLAARAGLGTRSVQHLERGESQPQRVTAQRLAAALALTDEQRRQFEALAQPIPRRRLLVEEYDAAGAVAESRPAARAHNLPVQLTSFVGREREVAEVTRLLDSTRLLTLTGTGGTGKTRLALQVATALLDPYPEGAWLVEFAAVADPGLVPLAVASAVGVREEVGQPLLATLVAALRPRRLLLVLDNCEHLLDACAALVEALLRGCPQVRILTTSREPVGIAGETVWRVPSLALPDVVHLPPTAELGAVEAVRLFVERALVAQAQFALTEQNAPTVAQVCRRLDGIPLALELAAARLRGLSLEQLAARLDQRFRLLTGGSRTALARQQTLQAAVDWSYSLLSVAEQTLFNRLAVFSGGFSLEAVEAVCVGRQIAADDVLDLLLRLVDKSLVVAEGSAGEVTRYRLLETLRQYGRERLLAGGEAEDLHVRHAAYYRALVEEARQALDSPHGIDRLDAEQLNLRQALRWALDTGATQEGLRLAGALTGYWHLSGTMAEGAQWLTELLALPEATERTTARARALTGLAELRRNTRMLDGAQSVDATTQGLVAEAISISRETGDKAILASALYQLGGWIATENYALGTAMLDECLALCRDLDSAHGLTQTVHRLGDVEWEQGDVVAAHSRWSEALAMARQIGAQAWIALTLGDLGMLAYHEGDYATAHGQIAESLAGYRAQHKYHYTALALGCLGAVARAQGDIALAGGCYEEKLAFWQGIGNRTAIAATLAEQGALAQQVGDLAHAQALFEEALTLRREVGNSAGVAASLAHLGDLAQARGDRVEAATRYAEGLEVLRATGDRAAAAACLEGLAMVAVAEGDFDSAARLYGAAASQRRGTFVLHVWDDRVARDRQVAAVRTALGEAFAAAWAAGQAMTPAEAVALP